jgi:hypothetical protein
LGRIYDVEKDNVYMGAQSSCNLAFFALLLTWIRAFHVVLTADGHNQEGGKYQASGSKEQPGRLNLELETWNLELGIFA